MAFAAWVDRPCACASRAFLQVGSVSTIITEQLQHQELNVEAAEATLLALGVHADTGSLTFDSATSRSENPAFSREGSAQRA